MKNLILILPFMLAASCSRVVVPEAQAAEGEGEAACGDGDHRHLAAHQVLCRRRTTAVGHVGHDLDVRRGTQD